MPDSHLQIQQYSDKRHAANVFFLTVANNKEICIVIDIGVYLDIRSQVREYESVYLFLTHAHNDHIAYINDLDKDCGNLKIFASLSTIVDLSDPKRNLSFYHESPISYNGNKVTEIFEMELAIQELETSIEVFETPGHTEGSLTYKLGHFLFTGDTWIPGLPTVTKLKGGDKMKSENSISRIRNMLKPETIICPGHGPMVKASEYLLGDHSTEWTKKLHKLI